MVAPDEDKDRIASHYRDRRLIEELEELKDQQWLALHPRAVKALERHNPDLLRQIEVPRERSKTGHGLPSQGVCGVCQGDWNIGNREFEEVKLNRVKRMLTMWSSYNHQSGDFVYLADEEGAVHRYPRSQAEREGFSLYGQDGQVTEVET